jgi:hypothetical protein
MISSTLVWSQATFRVPVVITTATLKGWPACSDLKGVAGVSWLGGSCYAVENELEDTEGAYIFEDFSTRILVFGDLMGVSCAAYVWALETGTITREGF